MAEMYDRDRDLLDKSAALYAELYLDDEELQSPTDTAIADWPE